MFAAVCVAWGREHSKELGQIKKAVTLKKVMAKMCGIEKWFVLHFDIKVKREVLKLAQLMLGLFCCSKTISYQ